MQAVEKTGLGNIVHVVPFIVFYKGNSLCTAQLGARGQITIQWSRPIFTGFESFQHMFRRNSLRNLKH